VDVLLAPFRFGARALDRFELLLDGSEMAQTRGAMGIRRALALGAFAAAIAMSAKAMVDGAAPGVVQLVMVMVGAVLYANRFGRFLRDWSPVAILIVAYAGAFGLVTQFALPVWYSPQIDADRLIGLGTLPTYRLQDWFGAADNHPLAVCSALAYLSHFCVPPLVGFALWWRRRDEAFNRYMYSLIAVNLLASVPWILAPTAPPWLAAQEGFMAAPVDVMRMGLQDMGLTAMVEFKDSNTYLIAAAVPSIHASWPLLGLLLCRQYRLPRWIGISIAVQLAAVWFAIVYSGEHYVIDIVIGVAFSVAAWRLVGWITQRGRRA
jgi:PAP2 superfamily protein